MTMDLETIVQLVHRRSQYESNLGLGSRSNFLFLFFFCGKVLESHYSPEPRMALFYCCFSHGYLRRTNVD